MANTLNVTKNQKGEDLTLVVEGRIDTTTAPQLEEEVKASIEGVTCLTFDMKGLEYISSAGLRILLTAQKTMNKQGKMIITGANENVMEIFEVTGFVDILTFQ